MSAAPSLLLLAKGSNRYDFSVAFIGCILGVTMPVVALSKFPLGERRRWEQGLCVDAALLMSRPGLATP